MKLLHWTVFIDLLGFQDINGEIKDLESAKELIEFMNSNKNMFEKQNSILKQMYQDTHNLKPDEYNLYDHYEISQVFISDSLIISFSPNLEKDFSESKALSHSANSLLIILQRLTHFIHHCAVTKKIFLRGGISNGYSYIDNHFAVGQGVGKAYIAESKHAKYPRVILAEDIVLNTKLMDTIQWLSRKMYQVDLIVKDTDNIHYLDFNGRSRIFLDARSKNPFVLNYAKSNPKRYQETIILAVTELKTYKDAIEFQIEKALKLKNSNVNLYTSLKEKYAWLSNYHNESCIKLGQIELAVDLKYTVFMPISDIDKKFNISIRTSLEEKEIFLNCISLRIFLSKIVGFLKINDQLIKFLE